MQAVERLLKEDKVDINQQSSQGFAPLCIAAFWGYSDIVKLLLEHRYVTTSQCVSNLGCYGNTCNMCETVLFVTLRLLFLCVCVFIPINYCKFPAASNIKF